MRWLPGFRRCDRVLLALIHQNTEKIMAAIDDLTTAVNDLKAEVATIGSDMDSQLAALTAAQASNNTQAIADATASIRASVDALKAAAARDMPAATPAPSP